MAALRAIAGLGLSPKTQLRNLSGFSTEAATAAVASQLQCQTSVAGVDWITVFTASSSGCSWVTALHSAAYYVCFHSRNHTIRLEVAFLLLASPRRQRDTKTQRPVHWEACAEAEKEIAMAKRESRGKWNVVCVACKVDSYCLGACDKFGGSLNRNSNRNSWQRELNEPAAVIAQSPHPLDHFNRVSFAPELSLLRV